MPGFLISFNFLELILVFFVNRTKLEMVFTKFVLALCYWMLPSFICSFDSSGRIETETVASARFELPLLSDAA